MAHFYGEVSGSARTTASRGAGRDNGIWSHTRGWGVGAEVDGMNIDGDDVMIVRATSGSGYGGPNSREVARFRETESGVEVVLYHPDTGNVVARHELTRERATA